MKRKIAIASGIILAFCAVSYFANRVNFGETQFYQDFKKIRKGMSLEEVEAFLGTGTLTSQKSIPGMVVPINPDDGAASNEHARKKGTLPTSRDYPTRVKPVVEGDVILLWKNNDMNESIYIAFKDGKVCETFFHSLNYL